MNKISVIYIADKIFVDSDIHCEQKKQSYPEVVETWTITVCKLIKRGRFNIISSRNERITIHTDSVFWKVW